MKRETYFRVSVLISVVFVIMLGYWSVNRHLKVLQNENVLKGIDLKDAKSSAKELKNYMASSVRGLIDRVGLEQQKETAPTSTPSFYRESTDTTRFSERFTSDTENMATSGEATGSKSL
jgi:hypothetical protein